MLRTNSKKAMENIRNYIIANFCFDNFNDGESVEPETFEEIAAFIYNDFVSCYINDYNKRFPESQNFYDWCSGLPPVLDTCYFYNRSAVEDLAEILEETETESSRFNESDAEKLLTSLIYREIKKAV